MSKFSYALQLYTVRDQLAAKPAATLKKVKAAGYSHIELAGTAGMEPAVFDKMILEAGIKPVSAHLPYETIVNDTAAAAEFARIFGIKYLAVPYIDPAAAAGRQGWLKHGEAMGRAGAELREAGIRLCYHNHAHEFVLIDGEYPIDLIMRAAAPEDLALELDTFWIKYAKLDPAAVLGKYEGRCPLLHIKDMAAKTRAFAEIGRGILNWREIFEKAAAAGVEWFIVEQDVCAGDSVESARISALYLGDF